MVFMNHNNYAILKIHVVNYPCINNVISKTETVDLLKSANLCKKVNNYEK